MSSSLVGCHCSFRDKVSPEANIAHIRHCDIKSGSSNHQEQQEQQEQQMNNNHNNNMGCGCGGKFGTGWIWRHWAYFCLIPVPAKNYLCSCSGRMIQTIREGLAGSMKMKQELHLV
jgi:hypothetical protein